MNRPVLAIGAALTIAILAVLFTGLGKDPSQIDSPLIGKPAPDFALMAVGTHEMVDVSRFRGKPLVVNFWATWCGPCWEEHPTLVEGQQRMGDRVQFLGVVFQDDESKIQNFLAQRGSAYPTVIDDRGKTAIAYGVGGVPETFFLDARGNIVAKYAGPLTPEILQSNIQKAMN